ncbi:hypothetical protein FNF29_00073 [Cafeteria roenbergensis]|uniref:CDP-diacylglycerol--inositol 3-phosphatidyltransferase n=1 Tax=Cafeteria roenbergensis TaxID=33653 RepID=A0A5A8CYQ6_CAFRO|nr:hypothetical protein FNF29_00073 [Cafeteria roenbergensis]|eukprot:KAA0157497.1 hypothetical protein FNF29_00073 [Cafeteria roenbergensis]
MGCPVVLFIPNLIGYARIALGVAAFGFVDNPLVFCALYFTSQGLDALDGVCARACGQTSRFGAVLDMVTDRFCTSLLLMVVGHQTAPQGGMPVAAALVALDFISHWFSMYADTLLGGTSHKDMSKAGTPWILQLYYKQIVLFVVCSLNEFFLLSAYAAAFGGIVALPSLGDAKLDGALQSLAGRAIPSLLPESGAPDTALARAFGWVLVVSFPVFVFKQLTSVVQLWWAAGRVAASDAAARARVKSD